MPFKLSEEDRDRRHKPLNRYMDELDLGKNIVSLFIVIKSQQLFYKLEFPSSGPNTMIHIINARQHSSKWANSCNIDSIHQYVPKVCQWSH